MALHRVGLLSTLGDGRQQSRQNGEDASHSCAKPWEQRPVTLDHLAEAVAPTVHGHHDIKKAILLMLIGGVPKEDIDGHHRRSTIHLCLLGDSATAKSVLLQWTAAFAPHGLYTSGSSSTSAGLTVAIVPNEEDGLSKTIKPGALLLASGGVCCIDDFDQMEDRDQSAIREVLDQQSVTVSKAGIHTKLASNTSVLLAGSVRVAPLGSGHSAGASAMMPLSLSSCFDLTFLLVDKQDSSRDEDLAWHIVEIACGPRRSASKEASEQRLRDHLQRARKYRPEISPEAQEHIQNWYVQSRKDGRMGVQRGMNRPSPRQLDGLVRLSEAVARGHLSTEVQVQHVEEALGLLRRSSSLHDTALARGDYAAGPVKKRARLAGRKQTASR